jgi:hypothetical protein
MRFFPTDFKKTEDLFLGGKHKIGILVEDGEIEEIIKELLTETGNG